jgi:Fe(3+) dicitrate transport protein
VFFPVIAQTTCELKGKVSNEQGSILEGVVVLLQEINKQTITDKKGEYQLTNIPKGVYTLVVFQYGYQSIQQKISLQESIKTLNIKMLELQDSLAEVTIRDAKNPETSFGIRKLNTIEGFAIYEGKKTEVIVLKDIAANLATNNARQVFNKVAGVNVWESDCAGLQLGIGARGLSPNRTANFNTRQNGYDISADAIGYPETYYTPPVEALDRIEVIRGAASLQYGTQFGGMLNFVMKDGEKDKKFQFHSRQTFGSYKFVNSFNSIGGTVGKWRYYAFYQRKQGDCWRCNSEFENNMAYFSNSFQVNEDFSIRIEYTLMDYLARQAGGLTQRLFEDNPRQSVRSRNWFRVKWNLPALSTEYKISPQTSINFKAFGMISSRESLGNLDRINKLDSLTKNRTLISDQYENWGMEGRVLHKYQTFNHISAVLIGFRHYRGTTFQQQGLADGTDKPHFSFLRNDSLALDYTFPNQNTAIFIENVFNIHEKLSITPGVRFENIRTFSEGYYQVLVKDGAGNIIVDRQETDNRERLRSFVLFGVGMSYKWKEDVEFYGNFSQNYRAVTFGDLRIQNPNFFIDPQIKDEKGYNADVGFRGRPHHAIYLDVSAFYLRYNDKIGTVFRADQAPLFLDYQYRTNVSNARTFGVEVVAEADILKLIYGKNVLHNISLFSNFTFNDGQYLNTDDITIRNKKIELVPPYLLRTGLTYGYKEFKATWQFSHVAKQYTDATNAETLYTAAAVIGHIPAYQVMDLSAKYAYKRWQIESGINNLLNNQYYTRRATSYPGPGIIPSEGRTFYVTLGVKI